MFLLDLLVSELGMAGFAQHFAINDNKSVIIILDCEASIS